MGSRVPNSSFSNKRKWINRKGLKVETVSLRKEKGRHIIQEVVSDRPIDLYTNLYAQGNTIPLEEYRLNTVVPQFDNDIDYNQLVNAHSMIISDENRSGHWPEEKLFVEAGIRCLRRDAAEKVLNIEFEDLDIRHLDRPRVAPIFDQYELGNADLFINDVGKTQTLTLGSVINLLGNQQTNEAHKFSIKANHNLIILAEAYNWIDEEFDETDRADITYTWRFTSGDDNYDTTAIDKIMASGRQLSIENIQREHIGTYTCEASNAYGKRFSFPIDIDVQRPGEIREVKIIINDASGNPTNEVLTNQMEWVANDASADHDNNYSVFDEKSEYDFINEDWVKLYYQQDQGKWYRDEDNSPWNIGGAADMSLPENVGDGIDDRPSNV